MSDRELLALAAKAAGIDYKHDNWDWKHDDHCAFWDHEDLCTCGARWNPLTDDGDALRLAVKLYLSVEQWMASEQAVVINHAEDFQMHEFHRSDPLAATRRAIVRAAAEIGRAMK